MLEVKTKGSAGEGAGAPCEFSALSVAGTAAGHAVLPGLGVLPVSSCSWSWRGNGGKAPLINCWGQVSIFFNKTPAPYPTLASKTKSEFRGISTGTGKTK